MDLNEEASKALNALQIDTNRLTLSNLSDANICALASVARGIRYTLTDFFVKHPESPDASCYLTQNNVLEINVSAAEAIFDLAQKDMLAPGMDKRTQFWIGLRLLALHETFHIVQGFIEYEKVPKIKLTAGPSELAKLDLVADCVSARLLALIDCHGNHQNYGRQLYANFSISLSLCTLAFPFDSDAKHKVERAISIFCVRQALTNSVTDPNEYGKARHYRFSPQMTIVTAWVIEAEVSDYLADTKVLTLKTGSELSKAVSTGNFELIGQLLSLVSIA